MKGKPPKDFWAFHGRGVDWLRSLGLEPIDCYLRVIGVLNGEIRLLSLVLKCMAGEDEDVKLLMTIPSFGYYTALLVKAEIDDVNSFNVPSTYSSGGVSRLGGITREGSRWLRWAVVEAVMMHIKYDIAISRSYHRIAERSSKQVAVVATAEGFCCHAIPF